MSKKSILTEAIAEARQIRETALENAKKQLEESLTPGIKKMLAHKLNEELELEEESIEEETLEEATDPSGFEPVKPKKVKKPVNEAEEDEEELEATEDEPEEEPEVEDPEAAEEEPEEEPLEDPEATEDSDESDEDSVEDPEAAEEEPEEEPLEDPEATESEIGDDTPLSDITVNDLKNIIADMVAAGTPATEPAPEGNEGADMNAADVDIQGTGEEEAPVSDGPQPAGMPAEDPAAQKVPADQPEEEESDEEIDLSELLKELEEEAGFEAHDQRGKGHDKNNSLEGKHQDSETQDNGIQEAKKKQVTKKTADKDDLKKAKKELAEALNTVKELKETLKEVNLVNSKLVYMTRTLNNNTLSESQKSTVIHTFDKAESIKEVKELYKMLQESFKPSSSKNVAVQQQRLHPRRMLAEHRGSASRFIGGITKPVEVDATVKRFQQLAGIITED